MNTAAIIPRQERCVCKCHGSESVCVTPSHLSTLFSVVLQIVHQPHGAQLLASFFFFWFLCLFAFMIPMPQKAVKKEVKGEGGFEMVELE